MGLSRQHSSIQTLLARVFTKTDGKAGKEEAMKLSFTVATSFVPNIVTSVPTVHYRPELLTTFDNDLRKLWLDAEQEILVDGGILNLGIEQYEPNALEAFLKDFQEDGRHVESLKLLPSYIYLVCIILCLIEITHC